MTTPPSTRGGAATGSRGAYAKSAARRREFVDAATALFAREGYRSATMLQIAAACGISRTGLLHHFPTKERLLEAVLQARDEATSTHAMQAHDEASPAVSGLLWLVRIVEYNATIPAIVNLYSVLSAEAADPTHPAHAYFVDRYRRSRANFEAPFRLAEAEGILQSGRDPSRLGLELVALMDGLQVQWLLDQDSVDMVDVVRGWIQNALTTRLPLT